MILIVTNARDLTSDFIVLELQRRGLAYRRLNTEALPTMRVDFGVTSTEDWSIDTGDGVLSGAQVTAAYFRRPGEPEVDPAVIDPGERRYCAQEWAALLKSLYLRLEPFWLNAPARIALAEDKPRQLIEASRLGLRLPEARITNDPLRLDRVVAAQPTIAKPLREAVLEGDTDRIMFTARVDRAIARDPRSIRAAPIILQAEVVKTADIRVTVVDRKVFACAIDSQTMAETEEDRRRGETAELTHRPVTLPSEIAERCIGLVAALGLRFGAIDLIEDVAGDYWFLECNPNGQWAWIETRTGHPIATAIVDALLAPAPCAEAPEQAT